MKKKISDISINFQIITFCTVFLMIFSSCQSNISRENLALEYFNLGNAYFAIEKYKEAADYYTKAYSLNPQINKIGYNLARALLENRDPQKALEIIYSLLETDPENIPLLKLEAYANYLLKNDKRALLIYEKILGMVERDYDALYNSALILKQQEEDAAKKAAANKKKTDKTDAGNKEENKESAAYKRLLKLYEIVKEDSSVKLNSKLLGNLLFFAKKENDIDKQIDFLSEYVKVQPKDRQKKLDLAALYVKKEDYIKAVEVYQTISEADKKANKKEPDIFFDMAVIYLTAMEDFQRGKEALTTAFDYGYKNKSELQKLLKREDLYKSSQVKALVDEYGLLAD